MFSSKTVLKYYCKWAGHALNHEAIRNSSYTNIMHTLVTYLAFSCSLPSFSTEVCPSLFPPPLYQPSCDKIIIMAIPYIKAKHHEIESIFWDLFYCFFLLKPPHCLGLLSPALSTYLFFIQNLDFRKWVFFLKNLRAFKVPRKITVPVWASSILTSTVMAAAKQPGNSQSVWPHTISKPPHYPHGYLSYAVKCAFICA